MVENDFIHLSFNTELEGIWEPRNPENQLLENQKGASDINEPDTPRISVGTTYLGCFQAIYPNISWMFEQKRWPYVDMCVYRPKNYNGKVVTNEDLEKKKLVWDAHITGEFWLLGSAEMVRGETIRIHNTVRNDEGLLTHPFNDKGYSPKTVYPSEIKVEVIRV